MKQIPLLHFAVLLLYGVLDGSFALPQPKEDANTRIADDLLTSSHCPTLVRITVT